MSGTNRRRDADQQPLDDDLAQERDQPKFIGSPVSRTTRMPTICLPQVWPLFGPSRAIRTGA